MGDQPASVSATDPLVVAAHDLISALISYFRDKEINEAIFVPLAIFSRMVRTHLATEIFLKEEHPTEASVLTLTQFELRLQLAYTAYDPKNATQWVEHEDVRYLSLNMRDRINSLFKDETERARLYSIFQNLSGIKHGNPVYSELGFSVRRSGRTFSISTGYFDDEFSKKLTDIVRLYANYQLAWSSFALYRCIGRYARIDSELGKKIEAQYRELEGAEVEFLAFLEKIVSGSRSFLGIKGNSEPKPA